MKVSVVQQPPVYLNLEKSLIRAVELIKQSAELGCKLIVFPETWLPGSPAGRGKGSRYRGGHRLPGNRQFGEWEYALQQLRDYRWDSGETWLATMQHIAREGGCWVIGCATALEASDIPNDIPHYNELFPNKDEWINPGDAVVYKPFGGRVAGPMHREKGLLIADIDVEAARASRRKFDASGHYARPDVFSLSVNRRKQSPATFT